MSSSSFSFFSKLIYSSSCANSALCFNLSACRTSVVSFCVSSSAYPSRSLLSSISFCKAVIVLACAANFSVSVHYASSIHSIATVYSCKVDFIVLYSFWLLSKSAVIAANDSMFALYSFRRSSFACCDARNSSTSYCFSIFISATSSSCFCQRWPIVTVTILN